MLCSFFNVYIYISIAICIFLFYWIFTQENNLSKTAWLVSTADVYNMHLPSSPLGMEIELSFSEHFEWLQFRHSFNTEISTIQQYWNINLLVRAGHCPIYSVKKTYFLFYQIIVKKLWEIYDEKMSWFHLGQVLKPQ